jgi:hypothetical protein
MASERILATGMIVGGGDVQWRISPLPVVEDEPQDGLLQQLIDEAADTDEYIDDIADRQFWSTGGW